VAKKKTSPRNERRAATRDAEKLAESRQKLARLEAGGVPDRPIEVESASQIEPHATATRCLRCDGANRLVDHAAETIDGVRLRAAKMACVQCGTTRTIWFRIAVTLPS
jgi:hypothetical protein